MADSELDEEEVSDDDLKSYDEDFPEDEATEEDVDTSDEEVDPDDDDSSDEGGDSEPTPEQKKKKQLIMVGAIVAVVIVTLVVVGMFFSGPEKTQEQIEEEEAKARKGVIVLTGYGEFLFEKIPDLANIPYTDDTQQQDQLKDATAEKQITTGINEKLPSGEVIFTTGENKLPSKKQSDVGVVLVDNMKVQKGENNIQIIQARIINQSSKYLAEVHLDILFLNSRGKTMFKRGVNPLVISGGLFGDKIQTLAPGASRTFYVDATEVPRGWSQEVNYTLVNYSFAP
ncbi:MAG: hypothetical protein HQL71_10540 [Magnetococcales bacterium]|nr:hypothetical protein [Magnetococcales bacterium]